MQHEALKVIDTKAQANELNWVLEIAPGRACSRAERRLRWHLT